MDYKKWLAAQKEITERFHSGQISEKTYWELLKEINIKNKEYRENVRQEKLETLEEKTNRYFIEFFIESIDNDDFDLEQEIVKADNQEQAIKMLEDKYGEDNIEILVVIRKN